jgi:hypothetical protein
LQDGTIGDELVIKPISRATRKKLSSHSEESMNAHLGYSLLEDFIKNEHVERKWRTDENDDYAFLDEDENLEDEDVMVDYQNYVNSPWNKAARGKRSASEIKSDLHVIYKRKDATLRHNSDYRKDTFIKSTSFLSLTVFFVDFMEADTFPTKSKDAHSRRKRQAPYIIFPEILCIVDYDGYR